MAVDKVKPLKIEDSTSGTESDLFPHETDPAEDYLAAKGIAFENQDTTLIDLDGSDNIQFTDPTIGVKKADDLQSTVRVSSNDTTPANLKTKLVAGSGISLVEQNDGSNETLQVNSTGAAGTGVIQASWSDSQAANPGLETPQDTYEVVAFIGYPGTNNVTSIDKIVALFMNEEILDPIDIKIFDVTNGNTIVEKNNIAGTTNFVFEPIDLGTLSNIPAAEAIFEVQIRLVDGTGSGPAKSSWIAGLSLRLL